MNLTELIAALRGFGVTVADGADLPAIITAVNAATKTKADAAQACNERDTARNDLAAARLQITNEQGVVSSLRTQLANERAAHGKLLFDVALTENRVTEADRDNFVTQFANDFTAATAALESRKAPTGLKTASAANVQKATEATATISGRQRAAHQLINERMTKGETYIQAFNAVQAERPDLFGTPAASTATPATK